MPLWQHRPIRLDSICQAAWTVGLGWVAGMFLFGVCLCTMYLFLLGKLTRCESKALLFETSSQELPFFQVPLCWTKVPQTTHNLDIKPLGKTAPFEHQEALRCQVRILTQLVRLPIPSLGSPRDRGDSAKGDFEFFLLALPKGLVEGSDSLYVFFLLKS